MGRSPACFSGDQRRGNAFWPEVGRGLEIWGAVVMRRAQPVLGKVGLARNGLYLTARPSAGLNHKSKLSWPVAKHGQSGNIEPVV